MPSLLLDIILLKLDQYGPSVLEGLNIYASFQKGFRCGILLQCTHKWIICYKTRGWMSTLVVNIVRENGERLLPCASVGPRPWQSWVKVGGCSTVKPVMRALVIGPTSVPTPKNERWPPRLGMSNNVNNFKRLFFDIYFFIFRKFFFVSCSNFWRSARYYLLLQRDYMYFPLDTYS